MRVLFDNGTPGGVAAALTEHIVEEARSHGWDALGNGELLDAAEAVRPGQLEGFKKQAAECIRITKEKDTRTLRYDWFLTSDGTECEVHEAYTGPEGLIVEKVAPETPRFSATALSTAKPCTTTCVGKVVIPGMAIENVCATSVAFPLRLGDRKSVV